MSAALETLPPDQRAVLQLILKQGRGYAELSGLLRIDETAVRARAHAGLEALAPNGSGAALTPERRGEIADWLLGQQAADAAAVTFQHLEDSRAARRWASELRDQLEPIARDHDLPALPAGRNGAARAAAPAAPVYDDRAGDEPGDELPAAAHQAGERDDPAADADAHDDAPLRDEPGLARSATAERARSARNEDAYAALGGDHRGPNRNSKIGGAILLLGVAALIAVALIVFLGGDDDGGSPATPAAQTTAQQQRTAAERAAADTPTVLQQVNLLPPGGREAGPGRGVAFIMLQGERPVVAVQAAEIDPNGERDVYAAWLLSRATGRARFLGFVPDFVRGERRFSVSAALPRDTARFDQVAVSRESIDVTDAPASPTDVVLVGTLRVNRAG